MRTPSLGLLLAIVAAAGCGGDDGGAGEEPKRPPATASAFTGCFKKAGYEAKRPAPREESVLAFQARREGFKVDPVNVGEPGSFSPAAFLVFFESPEKAAQAMEELKAKSYGEVPPVTRGPAVIGYGDRESRAAVEPAINACIE